MNYLNILRKPYLSLLMASLILFMSCNLSLDSPSVDPSLTSEYFNYVLSQSGNSEGASFLAVNETPRDVTDRLLDISSKKNTYNYSEDSFTATLSLDDHEIELHILPLSDSEILNRAHVFYSVNGQVQQDFIQVTIDNNGEDYFASCTAVYNSDDLNKDDECNDSIISCDCQEGASDVSSIGTVIAAAGLFGCVPCAFVGAAIAAVAAAGSLACPDEEV